MSSQELWAYLVRAAQHPSAVRDPGVILRAAMELGAGLGADTSACSVTELAAAGYRSVVWSDAVALDLDTAQYAADAGPCLSAARTGTVQHVAGPVEQSRYPGFAAVAGRHGVRSSLSLPLAGARRPAALNLYAGTPEAFLAPVSRQVADLLARCISRLMPSSQPADGVPTGAVAAALAQARDVRRAQDTLTAQHQLSRVDALALLIRRSRIEVRSIHDVAEDVAGGGGAEAAS